MNTMLKYNQRKRVYKEALKKLNKALDLISKKKPVPYAVYFCSLMDTAARACGYNYLKFNTDFNGVDKRVGRWSYPELAECKPKYNYKNADGYTRLWWSTEPSGIKKRIEVLEKIIEKMP